MNIGLRKVNVLLHCTWQEVFQIMQKRSVCYLTICLMKNHEIVFLTFLSNTKHTIKLLQKIHTSSLEYHLGELQRHCRVCGGRLNKAKGKVQPIYSCCDYPEDLKAFAGIDWQSEEDGSTFPGKFCNQCHVKLDRAKKASKDGLPFQPIVPLEWSPHQDHCSVRIIIIIITILIVMQLC